MRGLKSKRVLISGGTSGIGLATARRFLEEDARVFVAGRDPDKVKRALAELRPLDEIGGTFINGAELGIDGGQLAVM